MFSLFLRLQGEVLPRYAYFTNKQHQRSGTMREWRHKASAVDTEHDLLKCYRYIELSL